MVPTIIGRPDSPMTRARFDCTVTNHGSSVQRSPHAQGYRTDTSPTASGSLVDLNRIGPVCGGRNFPAGHLHAGRYMCSPQRLPPFLAVFAHIHRFATLSCAGPYYCACVVGNQTGAIAFRNSHPHACLWVKVAAHCRLLWLALRWAPAFPQRKVLLYGMHSSSSLRERK